MLLNFFYIDVPLLHDFKSNILLKYIWKAKIETIKKGPFSLLASWFCFSNLFS